MSEKKAVKPCARWRAATSEQVHHYRENDTGRTVEVRLNGPEHVTKYGLRTVDEICTDEIHLEQMDHNSYWMRINGVVFWFYARGSITLTAEPEDAVEFPVSLAESCENHEHYSKAAPREPRRG